MVQGEFPKITFDRLTQHAETDLQFLQRLADTWGGILRIDNDIVTFYLLQKVLDQDSELVISRSDVVRYAMRSKTADQPRASVSRHWDPVKKGQYKPLASPAQVPMGVVKMAPEAPAGAFPTLGAWGARIDVERVGHRAESTAQAEALMAAAMARAQLGKFQGTLSLPGDPRLRAGVPVALDGTWLGMAGIYVVTQAVHDLTKAGYQTHIDLAKGTSNAVKHRVQKNISLNAGKTK
jgi:phage protein D